MIQRRLRLIYEAELNRCQDDDDQNRQRDRRFDQRGASLPTGAFEWSCHIHVTLASLQVGETLVLQPRLHCLVGLASEIVIALNTFARRARLKNLWGDEHDKFGLASAKLA
jgi:hypothetical protein